MRYYLVVCLTIVLQFSKIKANESELTQYYFGYGSNLSYAFFKERLKDGIWIDFWHKDGELAGEPPADLGIYELPGYEFGYSLNVEAFNDTGTAANINPKEDKIVYGALYHISQLHLDQIDEGEDLNKAYFRVAMKVYKCDKDTFERVKDCEPITAWVYVGNPAYVINEERPGTEYVDLILKSAEERCLPQGYIDSYLKCTSLYVEKR